MQQKRMEASLTGALRREEVANTTIQKLEFEFEHMKRLVWLILILIRKMSLD